MNDNSLRRGQYREQERYPKKGDRNWSGRRAGVLVCVMVVLLLAGGLGAQTMQTLFVVRRGDQQRQTLVQARELIELGRAAAAQAEGNQDFRVEVEPGLEGHVLVTTIASDATNSADNSGQTSRLRISVTYPVDSPKAVNVTWEGSQ